MSEDGNTAIIGGIGDNANAGAVWVYIRSNDVWIPEAKLIGTGATGSASQGFSVAISADGKTAIVGGLGDNTNIGAVWIFVKSGGVWSQQGNKLVGTNGIGISQQGCAVSLSADGNTAIVGGFRDNAFAGAVWIFTRNGNVWSQQGNKIVVNDAIGNSRFGISVDLTSDGNTAIIGGHTDNADAGAAWIFTRSGNTWTSQTKLTGAGAIGNARFGRSVSISSDGNTAIVGGYEDDAAKGAVWVFTRTGSTWSQQGNKLVGTGATGNASQGFSISLSGDGNTAVVGGIDDNAFAGATWVFSRSGGVWSQSGNKLFGSDALGIANQGGAVAISPDGNTIIVGGIADNTNKGAAWVFIPTSLQPPGWQVQNSGVIANFKAIHFASPTFGGAVGTNGTIITTSNGGDLWSARNSGTTEQLWDIHFISESNAWVVGNNGTILHTSNGGSTWTPQVSGTANFLFDVVFVSPTIGWAVGSNGLILNTVNGGNTWTPQTSGTTATLRAVFFVSENEGWAVGLSNTVLKTTNAGTTWIPQIANFGSYYDVHFISATQGWIVGGGSASTVVTTTDGGINWINLPTGFTPLVLAVHFVSPTIGWYNVATPTTSFSSIKRTSDGGVTWTVQQTPISVATEDAYFINAGLGWAVGNNGIILKYIDPTVGIDEYNITEINDFVLEQNYPNPFNPSTNIQFALPQSGFVTLEIFSVTGERVDVLFSEELSAGKYNYEWNGSNLTSGIYFYRLNAGNFVKTRKMILLK
ncbi:MAG: YCF48-related protein [Ignavibacterium sp.]|nr:YCF48-related protein [Ignavibacterium sp.]